MPFLNAVPLHRRFETSGNSLPSAERFFSLGRKMKRQKKGIGQRKGQQPRGIKNCAKTKNKLFLITTQLLQGRKKRRNFATMNK